MRHISRTMVLLVLLAAALLTTVLVRAQAIAEPAHQADEAPPAPHPGERSQVRGFASLPDWDRASPLILSTEAIPAPNDRCSDPITATLSAEANQYSIQVDTRDATTDAADPLQSCTIGGPAVNTKSVWWSFRAPEDGELSFSTITANPERYDTVVTFYPAEVDCDALSPAEELACDDDTNAFQSQVTTLVDAGRWYLVEVTGWGIDNPGGELDLVAYFRTDTHWHAPPGAGLPQRLHRHVAVTDGFYLYVLGGQDPFLTDTVYRYDPELAIWNILQDIPSPYSNTDGAYLDGRIYLPSGYVGGPSPGPYQGIHQTYIISDDIWTVSAPMTSTGTISEPIAWGAAAADPNLGLYYYTGGRYGTVPDQPLNTLLEYDATTDSWRSLPPMLTPRRAHEAVFLKDKLCIAGGLDPQGNPLSGGECFDPLTETWSSIADMHLPRAMFGSAVGPDGQWYVFGGRTVDTDAAMLTTPKTERYDPETNTWTLYDQHWSLNQSREWLTGTAIGAYIFAAGGFIPITADEGLVVDSFEELVMPKRTSCFNFLPLVRGGLADQTVTDYEPNDAIPFAFGPLSSGTTLASDFGYAWDAEDFFYLDATVQTDIEVHLSQIPAGSNYDLYLYGTDDNGTLKSLYAASRQVTNLDESFVVSQAPPGRYYIRVQNFRLIPSSQPYLLSVVY